MKAGFTTSLILHTAALAFGLLTLSAPSALEVANMESLPVDIVVESMTQIQKGDKKAPMKEESAPVPTTRPDTVPDATEVGDNQVDTPEPPTPEPKPKPVETAAVPAPSPEPTPKPVEETPREIVPEKKSEPVPVPATEVTPQPQPKQEVKPDPVAETIVKDKAEAEAVKLPENAPSPEAKPKPPQAQTAKAPDRKDADKPATEAAAKPKSEEDEVLAAKVLAELNKEKPSGGGAKRSQQEAALGGTKKTAGSKLSQSEMDALRGQVQECWNPPSGVENAGELRPSVRFNLDRAGKLDGAPELIKSTGNRQADEAALRAVNRCGQRGFNLPAEKYDTWAEVVVNFDPSEMF